MNKERNRRTVKKQGRLLRLSLIIFFCLLTGYGMARLIPYIADLITSRQTSGELQQIQSQAVPGQDPSGQALSEFGTMTPDGTAPMKMQYHPRHC